VRQPLREYQAKAIAETREAYRAGKRAPLLVAPTGAGKTRIGTEFAHGALAKSKPGELVLWLAHREELLIQARDRLVAEGVPRVGIIAAGEPLTNAPIQVASIQTLVARAKQGLPKARLVVLDEAHHYAASTWGEVAAFYQDVPRIGLTATPERGDGKALGDIFDHIIPVSSVRELQALGVLVPCVTYAPATRTKELSQHPVAAYQARTPGERGFCFCVNVTHAEKLAIEFAANGTPAATIHADTPWLLRRARLEAFRLQDPRPLREAGVLEPVPLVLCNVYTLTEGVDVPEASSCILARGCGHAGLYLQMVGRVLRAAPGKERAVLIDLRGAVHKLGLPEQDREWSLEGKAISLSESEREEKLKVCPACGGTFAGYGADRDGYRTCPICRERLAPPADPEIKPRELHQMGGAADPETQRAALWSLSMLAASKGWKRGAVAAKYKERFGAWPPRTEQDRAWASAVDRTGGTCAYNQRLDAAVQARAERQARMALEQQAAADAEAPFGG
jgi:DNA repair protein RadD